MRIAANLAEVQARIGTAATQAGRRPEAVRLVAVTKYVDAATTRLLVDAGCRDLGEARPQQLWDKAAELAELGIRWHLIGHLQRNKVRRTLPLVHLLHSGDSLRLLEELDAERAAQPAPLPVLLEVNVSGDAAKHGFAVDDVPPLVESLAKLAHLDVRGLMCMAGLEGDAAEARREFAALRELRDRLRREWSGRYTLDELSMGMSGDFEAAIAEGSTMVRVGSALFEGLDELRS
ncbi:MAG: YggS family pyridoxal phosphate-dependent enzyme [Pirellula sp.]|nr:YggS family pyridoxal phosphate-dependent enzyme [Pirellula sp.]